MNIGDMEHWDNVAAFSKNDGNGNSCRFQLVMVTEKTITARDGIP